MRLNLGKKLIPCYPFPVFYFLLIGFWVHSSISHVNWTYFVFDNSIRIFKGISIRRDFSYGVWGNPQFFLRPAFSRQKSCFSRRDMPTHAIRPYTRKRFFCCSSFRKQQLMIAVKKKHGKCAMQRSILGMYRLLRTNPYTAVLIVY